MTRIVDLNGNDLLVGSRVCTPGAGVVAAIGDPDGDVDEGRIVGIPPYVVVTLDSGDEFVYSATQAVVGWMELGPYTIDEVEVAA